MGYNGSNDSKYSDTSLDAHEGADESVIQEMARLEDIFRDEGLNFRMIDQIGEGSIQSTSTVMPENLTSAYRNLLDRL